MVVVDSLRLHWRIAAVVTETVVVYMGHGVVVSSVSRTSSIVSTVIKPPADRDFP